MSKALNPLYRDREWQLGEDQLIGSGKHHRCFHFPGNAELCVKTLQPAAGSKMLRREVSYYRHLQKRNIDWSMLARFHGTVKTSLGPGMLFERVTSMDGNIAPSLEQILSEDQMFTSVSDIATRVNQLVESLWQQSIVISDLNLGNLLVRHRDQQHWDLVIIDGIGHNDFIPLCQFNRRFAQRKIARTWNRNIERWFGHYPQLRPLIAPLPEEAAQDG